MIPVVLEDPLCPRAYLIYHENPHTQLPTKCIICLPEVKEYFIEYLLPNFYQLLENIGFEGGGYYPPDLLEPMENVM